MGRGTHNGIGAKLTYIAGLVWKKLIGRRLSRRVLKRHDDFIFKSPVGLTFHIRSHDLIGRAIVLDGLFERQFVEFIAGELPEGAVVVDIGANIGNHALYFGKRAAVVHCYEPNPVALDELRYNIALNDAQNLVVHEVGLGAADGEFPFLVNLDGNVGNSGFEQSTYLGADAAHRKTLTLAMRQADRELARLDLPRLDYIKIDVEGMEADVIESLVDTVARHRPMISFEYHAHLVPMSLFDRIAAALPGYIIASAEMLRPGEGGLRTLPQHWSYGGRLQVRRINRPEHRSYENLLAIPEESAFAAKYLGVSSGDH